MPGMQILIVDDDVLHSKLVSFLLQDAGHSVEVAWSAEGALELLRSFRPELILVDLDLPGKDGVELIGALRLNPVHAATPVITLSAYADRSVLAKAREAGSKGSIAKPIDPASFARQLRDCVAGNPKADADAPSDSGDLLAEMRNNFLAQGLDQCDRLLNSLKSSPDRTIQAIHRRLHRWPAAASALGFSELCSQASRMKALFASAKVEGDEVAKSIDTTRRRFCAATRYEPEFPVELITGLLDERIGLVNFSEEEARRIRDAAERAHVKAVFESMRGDSLENQSEYGALVINECGGSSGALRREPVSIPAIFIGSRSSLEALSKLPAHGCDIVIAPWDAEEVLLRVHRLIRKPAQSRQTEDSQAPQKRRPRVLIADDDPDMVFLVSDALGQFGMECEIARSGRQVMDAIRRQPPDAVVLDVNMMDISGFEILERLRQNLATKALPVVLLTGRSQGRDIARGFGCGADDYVIKPFQAPDLARRVQRAISESRKSRSVL